MLTLWMPPQMSNSWVNTFLWYNTDNILLVQEKDLMEQKPTDFSVSKNSDSI